MNYIEIKTKECFESKTNPRGSSESFKKDSTFKDLVSSIKEKGVLSPIIVRLVGKKYEVVAGNRRFAAACELELETVPTQVMELNDDQAREVQIIENLQRADIHPIDEGQSFRSLIEKHKLDVKTVATRIGKSESYVRYRLFLTNLIPAVASMFRKGDITDKHAQLIGKLTEGDQKKVVDYIKDEYSTPDVEDLNDFIQKNVYDVLSNQPWLLDKEITDAVGKCVECNHSNLDLFGESNGEACNNTKCWARKMDKYIKYYIEKLDIKVRVSSHYGTPDDKTVVSLSNYEKLGNNKKKHCESVELAILVDGEHMGSTIYICRDPKCETHHSSHSSSNYSLTPEEKAERKAETIKENAKKAKALAKRNQAISDSLATIGNKFQSPVARLLANTLIEEAHVDYIKVICERLALEPVIKEEKNYMDETKIRKVKDWKATLTNHVSEITSDKEMFGVMVEVAICRVWETNADKFYSALAKLNN